MQQKRPYNKPSLTFIDIDKKRAYGPADVVMRLEDKMDLIIEEYAKVQKEHECTIRVAEGNK